MTDIPVGYKQTEVGIIPNDWDVIKLETLTTIITKQTGFDYSATIKPSLVKRKSKNVYSFIQNKDFSGCDINLNTDFYIPISVADKFPNITLDTPSLLVSISGKIGNVGYYNLKKKAFIGGAVGICKLKEGVNGPYIVYYLQSDRGQKIIHGGVKASSHLNITVEDIRELPILMPKNEEQQTIATTLSDMDKLISSLDELIKKKKNIKKGAMQKLLSPKEGWIETTLGEIVKIQKGKQINGNLLNDNGLYKYLNGGIEASGYVTKYNSYGGIAISEGGNSCGYVNYMTDKYWCGGHCYEIKPLSASNIYELFLYQLLKYNEKNIMSLRVGSGLPNIQRKALEGFYLSVPSRVEEQQAIATILSDMDKEIEALEQKKAKYENIKQGAMQKLLTGKIRLI